MAGKLEIDLNCDLGEGAPHDAELMPLITSASIACGFHAGDPGLARNALLAAKQNGVQVGAHPSFPDREHFGRREMDRTEEQIFEDCVYQIGGLAGLARAVGIELRYVKPHGALYNMACREDRYARPVVAAAKTFDLALLGLPGSRLEIEGKNGCGFIAEGFADRRYRPDGSLVPRSDADAMLDDPDEAVQQAKMLLETRRIRTLCVHGDNPEALVFVRELRKAFEIAGIVVKPFRI
jgi:5-oxoprolinase (ATP-hydrolysing) subunit A